MSESIKATRATVAIALKEISNQQNISNSLFNILYLTVDTLSLVCFNQDGMAKFNYLFKYRVNVVKSMSAR